MKIKETKMTATYKQEVISSSCVQVLFCMYLQNTFSLWSKVQLLYSLNMCPTFVRDSIKILNIIPKERFMGHRRCNYEF